MIYLDNCATTAVDEDVAYAAFEMMRKFYGNPSSPYGLGREVLRRVTEARHQVAQDVYKRQGIRSAARSATWCIRSIRPLQILKCTVNF